MNILPGYGRVAVKPPSASAVLLPYSLIHQVFPCKCLNKTQYKRLLTGIFMVREVSSQFICASAKPRKTMIVIVKKGDRDNLLLLVHQAPGDNIVQALLLPGECDNDEPDKEGEDREHFCEKAEGCT